LICYQTHKSANVDTEDTGNGQILLANAIAPDTSQEGNGRSLLLQEMPLDSGELHDLFCRYPTLRPQLDSIFKAAVKTPSESQPNILSEAADGGFVRDPGSHSKTKRATKARDLIQQARHDKSSEGFREFCLFAARIHDAGTGTPKQSSQP